jgi:D-2-hydroxyacid dehydrogenase (NADP+)
MKVLTSSHSPNPFWKIPPQKLEALRSEFPEIEFVSDEKNAIQNADIFFGYRLQPEELRATIRLKWIHVPAANVYGFDTQILQERKILLTNSRGSHAGPIAEHVIGCMLVSSRRFQDCWKFQQQAHYAQIDILNQPPPLSELNGKTVVILGLGAIGNEIARLAKAFRMRVLGIKRRVENPQAENVDLIFKSTEVQEALPQADFLVIAAARTNETEGMLGETELALLKSDAVIINIARAQIIKREALFKILQEGRIRGAALDVFYEEPLPSDSPLYRMPNVFLTPHIAGVNSTEHWNRMIALFSENLQRFLQGRALQNVVDLSAGY